MVAPRTHAGGATRCSQSVATHDCTRDTVRGGAVATGVPHPLMGEGYCLRTVAPCCATRRCVELARRLRTRCLRGVATESPDPSQTVELRIGLIPEILEELFDRENRDLADLSSSRFQADTEIAFEFPFLC